LKLISFLLQGKPSYGIVSGDDVLDLTPILGDRAPDLKALIAGKLLPAAADALKSHKATLKYAQLTLLPVIPNPNKFLRLSESQVAHGQDIVRPPESTRLDYEGEIALIIGKGGRRISEADAWTHIAGYACYNDASVRDWQVQTSQWTAGKNFWRTGGFGPWMVTADEIRPDQVMTLVTRLNGQELQRTTTDKMIHSIPRQLAYISTFIPLEPGDVIVTGTPGGVGNKRNPQVFMKPGDVVEVDVDAIGILRNGIRDDVKAAA
jgi:2-keto-4-pentenoate hydratase/2-oxohepta-3-ene-1,7-dioic acid hydratase in catechol pathway